MNSNETRHWCVVFWGCLMVFAILVSTCHSGFAAEKPKALPATKAKAAPADKSKAPSPNETSGLDTVIKSESPLHITSERMEVMQNDKIIIFEGHVVVQQDDWTITGNRMKVYGASKEKEQGKGKGKAKAKDKDSSGDKASDDPTMMNKIDHIEMEGDVRIVQREKLATSDKAVFYHQEQKVLLIGHPSVTQGRDTVKGRLITLYLAEGKSVVEGGEETPVHAVLHPSKKEQ